MRQARLAGVGRRRKDQIWGQQAEWSCTQRTHPIPDPGMDPKCLIFIFPLTII